MCNSHKEKIEEEERAPRECNACGCGMWDGFCINGGEEYFCSDNCLHTKYSQKEYNEMYDNGDGDSYWTEWSEDDIEDEDEDEDEERTTCEMCEKSILLSNANMNGNTYCNECFLKVEDEE